MASLGPLVLWPLARQLYLISWVWALLHYTFAGASFGYGLVSLLAALQTMLGGAILSLAYCSPLADAFGKSKREPDSALGGRPPAATRRKSAIKHFLTSPAVEGKVAAATQNQALSALLFLYRNVPKQDLPWLDDVVHAKPPEHLPVVLTREEVRAVVQPLDGTRV